MTDEQRALHRAQREQCIGLEAASIATTALARGERKTFQMIVDEAITKVDEAAARGELWLLHGSWITDPETRSGR